MYDQKPVQHTTESDSEYLSDKDYVPPYPQWNEAQSDDDDS